MARLRQVETRRGSSLQHVDSALAAPVWAQAQREGASQQTGWTAPRAPPGQASVRQDPLLDWGQAQERLGSRLRCWVGESPQRYWPPSGHCLPHLGCQLGYDLYLRYTQRE